MARQYVSADFKLDDKNIFYAGKGTVKETVARKAQAVQTLKKILVDTDIERVKQGAAPATPTLSNWIKKANEVKVDNDLMSKGQMPIYSKPTYEQLQKMHAINQETRKKLDPNTELAEIQLRTDELEDRKRILDGQLPVHRQATKRELDYVANVLNNKTLKSGSLVDAISGNLPLIKNVTKDFDREFKTKKIVMSNGINDDATWHNLFSDIKPGLNVPGKPVSYDNWLTNMPAYPGNSYKADDAFRMASSQMASQRSPYSDSSVINKIGAGITETLWGAENMFGKALGFAASFVVSNAIEATGRTDWMAAKDVMEKNRELPWQVTTDYMDQVSQRITAVYTDPTWSNMTTREKFAPQNIVKTAAMLIPDIASSIIGYAIGGPATIASSQAYDMYNLARQYGVSEREAYTIGIASGVGEAILDRIGFNSLMGHNAVPASSSLLKRIAGKILTSEAITEGIQNVYQKALESTFRDDLGWDEFAETTAMSILGGAVADVTFGSFNSVLKKMKAAEYADLKFAENTGSLLDSAIPQYDQMQVQKDAFNSNLMTKKVTSMINPISEKRLNGPTINPLKPTKVVKTQQEANSIRTGDSVYIANNSKEKNIRVIADPLGRSYDEYEAAKVRVMNYDEAVTHMQENYNNLTPNEQSAVKDILDFSNRETLTIDNVGRAMQIYTDPTKYNAVMVRDDIRGTVMVPFGMENIKNSADLLALRNSMMNELLNEIDEQAEDATLRRFMNDTKSAQAYQQLTNEKMLKEMYELSKSIEKTKNENPFITEARNYENFEAFKNAMIDGIATEVVNRMKAAKKNISVQKVIMDKYTAKKSGAKLGMKVSWSKFKPLLQKMVKSKMHNLQEAQQLAYAWMVKNPTVNKYFTPTAKNLIMKKIVALGKKTTEASLSSGLNSVIATIDRKMVPARLRAILDKAIPAARIKKAKLDWEGSIRQYDRWRALPDEIKAAKAAATAEMSEENLARLDDLINEQREIYDDARMRMHEKMEQEKMNREIENNGLKDEIINAGIRKSKRFVGDKGKMLANPTLTAEFIGPKMYDMTVGMVAEYQALGDNWKRAVAVAADNIITKKEKIILYSQSLSTNKNAINKYGINLQITTDGMQKEFKFSKAEIAHLYMCANDPDARYALVGENSSQMHISRDPNLPSVFFTMDEAQLNKLIEVASADEDIMMMVNFATEIFKMGYEEFAKIYKTNTGLDLPNNPNYVPIDVWGAVMEGFDNTMVNGSAQQVFAGFEQALGMLKQRKRNVKKTVKVNDLMGVVSKYQHSAGMYISYGIPVKKLSMMMNSIGEQMSKSLGEAEIKYWKQYIKNLNPFFNQRQTSTTNKVANFITSRAIKSILWGKITAVLKQPASLFVAGSVDPNFGVMDMVANSSAAFKFISDNSKKEVLYDVIPELFGIRLTSFDPTLADTGITPANDLLSLIQYDKTFKGRSVIEKISKIGMEPLVKMNNVNYDFIASAYLSKMAKMEGKDINTMPFTELSNFAKKHEAMIRKILLISQPQYGLANRIPALVDQSNWLAKTLFMFRAASLAGINATRRAIELGRQGRINKLEMTIQLTNGFIIPALWCSLITIGWREFKEWLSADDEKTLKKIEEEQSRLLEYVDVIAQETSSQFPLLGEVYYYVKKISGGNTYGVDAISAPSIEFINKAFSSVAGLGTYAKFVVTKEEYEKSGNGYKKGEIKYKNQKNIEKAVENGIKILDSLMGMNLSEPTKIINSMID